MRSLKDMVAKGKVAPMAAAAVAPHPEDKEELAKMKPTAVAGARGNSRP
jgi:hypothetical protein